MKCDGERFDKRGVREGQAVRKAIQDMLRNGHEFGEGTCLSIVFARYAKDTTMVAEVNFPPSAVLAATA